MNAQTGAVVLDADDIDDASTSHKFASAAQLTQIATNQTHAESAHAPSDAEANRALASQAEAETGTDNVKGMTPLRVAQAFAALASGGGGLWQSLVQTLQTTDGTTTTVDIDDVPIMSDGDAYLCRARIVGRKSDLTKIAYWTHEWYVYHSSGFPLSVNAAVSKSPDWNNGSPAWTAIFGGDSSKNRPYVRVTGASGETVDWTLILEYYKVAD